MTINNINNAKPVALVVPLDWGLGHATRCIPIIKECLIAGFEVIIAAEGSQEALLKAEFPTLFIINLKGYRLKYASTKWLTILKIILQIPKILIAINREKKWLSNFTNNKPLALIIADNRFGLYKTGIASVFITHQLYIKTPFGIWVNKILQKINYHFINRFTYCWVPDAENEKNLGGELSHPHSIPLCKLRYIDVLSRIKKENISTSNKILILLSGPEPQRSILETNLLQQLKEFSIPAFFVRGLPLSSNTIASTALVKIVNHFTGEQLQHVINQSEIIISRPGYTTIMEVLPLNKKCIFIPTPGQTEQEYLADYLTAKSWACSGSQNGFSLPVLIKKAEDLQLPDLSFLAGSAKLTEAMAEIVDAIQPACATKQDALL